MKNIRRKDCVKTAPTRALATLTKLFAIITCSVFADACSRVPTEMSERRRVLSPRCVLVPERVRGTGLRAGRGRVRDRCSRVSRPVVPLRQHGRMVLLRVQSRLPERHHDVSRFVGRRNHHGCARQRFERPGTHVVAFAGHDVPRWVKYIYVGHAQGA